MKRLFITCVILFAESLAWQKASALATEHGRTEFNPKEQVETIDGTAETRRYPAGTEAPKKSPRDIALKKINDLLESGEEKNFDEAIKEIDKAVKAKTLSEDEAKPDKILKTAGFENQKNSMAFKARYLMQKDKRAFSEYMRAIDHKEQSGKTLNDYEKAIQKEAWELPASRLGKELSDRTGYSVATMSAKLDYINSLEGNEKAGEMAMLLSYTHDRQGLAKSLEGKSGGLERLFHSAIQLTQQPQDVREKLRQNAAIDPTFASAFGKEWGKMEERIKEYSDLRSQALSKVSENKFAINDKVMNQLKEKYHLTDSWMLRGDAEMFSKFHFDEDTQQTRFFVKPTSPMFGVGLRETPSPSGLIQVTAKNADSVQKWMSALREQSAADKLEIQDHKSGDAQNFVRTITGSVGTPWMAPRIPTVDLGSLYKGKESSSPTTPTNTPGPAPAESRSSSATNYSSPSGNLPAPTDSTSTCNGTDCRK